MREVRGEEVPFGKERKGKGRGQGGKGERERRKERGKEQKQRKRLGNEETKKQRETSES